MELRWLLRSQSGVGMETFFFIHRLRSGMFCAFWFVFENPTF